MHAETRSVAILGLVFLLHAIGRNIILPITMPCSRGRGASEAFEGAADRREHRLAAGAGAKRSLDARRSRTATPNRRRRTISAQVGVINMLIGLPLFFISY